MDFLCKALDEISAEATRLRFDAKELVKVALGYKPEQHSSIFDTTYLKSESIAWATHVSLTIRLESCDDSVFGFIANCEISWSSTGRCVSQAVQSVAMYQRAIELACIIEGVLS